MTTEIPASAVQEGQYLQLDGRPCQVTQIIGPDVAGLYVYNGVNAFTNQPMTGTSSGSDSGSSQIAIHVPVDAYRVVNLENGYATCIDNEGNSKKLEVIDRSDIMSRMTGAFRETEVHALVLSDGEREAIVDMDIPPRD